jgi:glutamine cyclotransferase
MTNPSLIELPEIHRGSGALSFEEEEESDEEGDFDEQQRQAEQVASMVAASSLSSYSSFSSLLRRYGCWSLLLLVVIVSFAVALVGRAYLETVDDNNNDAPSPFSPTSPPSSQQPQQQKLFNNQQWKRSKVTLQDGPMFEVRRVLAHDAGAFLEGLTYAEGYLFESTGLEGQSSIRKLNAQTGDVIELYQLQDTSIFGEGLAYANNGKLYQITYKKKMGFIYNVNNISQPIDTFTFDSTTGEGWGLTFNPKSNELIMSDGSDVLHMVDVDTLQPTRTVKVVREGNLDASNINELEFFHGKVLANVWYRDYILVIDPDTGIVEKEYDFATIWPQEDRRQSGAGVLNGISVARHPAQLYITGKNWDRMYLLE